MNDDRSYKFAQMKDVRCKKYLLFNYGQEKTILWLTYLNFEY